jgi:2Fe-2S ferredoxin
MQSPELFMPLLHVVNRDGAEQEVQATSGGVLMETLRDMDDGVMAICGGMCSCATCHVYVDEAWVGKLPAAMSDETDMLKDLSSYRPNSRLSCQLQLTDALDGLRVAIAPEE